jgi:hypothetical protein
LSDGEFRVAVALILYFHNTLSGECFPSIRQLAEASNTSHGTASRAVHRLKAIGVLSLIQSNGGRCQRNTYTLGNLPPVEGIEGGNLPPVGQKPSTRGNPRVSTRGNAYIRGSNPKEGQSGKSEGAWPQERPDGQWDIPHGCKSYAAWRRYCLKHNLPGIYSFKDQPGHVAVAPSEWPPR